jgi:hypothetical protein
MTLALAMGIIAVTLGKDVLHLPDPAALFTE